MSSHKAPQGYQPTGQGAADQGYQALTGSLSKAGMDLYNTAAPGFAGVTSAVQNNPYYQQAQTGADQAAAIGSGVVAPGQFYAAGQDMGMGDIAGANANAAFGAGQNDYANAAQLALQRYQQGQSLGTQYLNTGAQAAAMGSNAYTNAMGLLPQMMQGYGVGTDETSTAQQYAGMETAALPQATAGYGYAQGIMNNTLGMIPQYMQGNQYATGIMADALSKGNTAWDESQALGGAMIGSNMPAAQQLLANGFDPQGTLHDRSYQQMLEHQNAINAQNGVSGSPFAAGVTGDASRNFDIDWQNNQLGRESTALQGYDAATANNANIFSTLMNSGSGTYDSMLNAGVGAFNSLNAGDVSNYASLMGTGTGAFNSLTNSATGNLTNIAGSSDQMINSAKSADFSNYQASMNNAAQRYQQMLGAATGAYGTMTNAAQGYDAMGLGAMNSGASNYTGLMGTAQNALNSGVSNFNSLAGTQQNAYANASDLGAAGLNTLTTAAMYPNQVYMNNQAQILQALQAQVQGTNASMDMTQAAVGDYGNYMKIGQSATQLAQSATSINNAASQATWQGIGQLAGLAMAPFTGGMSLAAMAPATAGAGKETGG